MNNENPTVSSLTLKRMVKEHLAKTDECLVFGVPLSSMTVDELKVVAMIGWQMYNERLQNSVRIPGS